MFLLWIYALLSGIGLYIGAEMLVKGSSQTAKYLRISPLIIGVTVVAFGTSAPEMIVTSIAAIKNTSGIALGNIIGSNIANIGLVLGLSALIRPVQIDRQLIRRDIPISIIILFVFYGLSIDNQLNYLDGSILLTLMIIFTILSIRWAKKEHRSQPPNDHHISEKNNSLQKPIFLSILGIILISASAYFFLYAATTIARAYNISEYFIGISMVALGTSLPELITSLVAAIRGHDDLCIANVIGSNIMNILLAIGIAAVIAPIEITQELISVQYPIMLAFGILLLPLTMIKQCFGRIIGCMLLFSYSAFIYVTYIM